MRRFSVDEARLLPRFRDRGQLEQQQADVSRGESQRAAREGVDVPAPRWKIPVGDDFQRLRGLPSVAPGVRGVSLAPIRLGRCSRKSAAASSGRARASPPPRALPLMA
jgi:hypothetical protein